MITMLSSIITAFLYRDKIEEKGIDGAARDPDYLTVTIGFTFILEMFTYIVLLIRKIIKK